MALKNDHYTYRVYMKHYASAGQTPPMTLLLFIQSLFLKSRF